MLGLRHRAVGSPPEKLDLQAVCGRCDRAGAPGHGAGRPHHHVLSEDHVGLRESLEQAVVDHCLRALAGLFGRLEYGHQRTAPRRSRVRQQLRCAGEPGDMHIVAAHVGHGDRIAVPIGRGRRAGVRETGRFLNRQRVHVSAEHDGRAVAVAK